MEFDQVSKLFRNRLTEILDSADPIDENHIKDVAALLKQYATLNMKSDQIKVFLDNILVYFVFLNKYAKQFPKISALQHYIVRMALGVFVFVVDTVKGYQVIIKIFRKIIDVIVETEPQNSNVKEFLRIYSHLLNKISVGVIEKLAIKHQSYLILHKILKETGDIETQAIIVEVVFKLLRNNNHLEIDKTFQELMQFSSGAVNMYQNIRMMLDHVNEYSTNIFSINCSTIELDSQRITEFYGAGNADDIWLDFNLLQNKISFFCEKNFAASVGEMKFYSSSTWEVLCFSVENILKIEFDYNTLTESLNILILLNTSSFDVFASVKSDTQRKLAISVSKYCERFSKLIHVVLPKIFVKSFSAQSLNIPEKSDSSETASGLLVNDSDSSPIIERFAIFRKFSTRGNSSPLTIISGSHDSDSDSDSVVLISDNERENVINNGNLNSRSRVSVVSTNSESKTSQQNSNVKKNKIDGFKSKSFKVSTECKEKTLFNKSVSPLSFTESVFARSRRTSRSSRSSKSSEQNFVSERQRKNSTLDAETNHEKTDKILKISTMKHKKISSSLIFPIIKKKRNNVKKKRKLNKKTKEKPKEKPKEKTNEKTNECVIEEVLDKPQDDLLDVSLNCPIHKVKDWLENKVDNNIVLTTEVEKEIVEIPCLPEKESELLFDSAGISKRNTGRSSSLALEEKIGLLMGENKETEEGEKNADPEIPNNTLLNNSKNVDKQLNPSTSLVDLLNILSDGEQVGEINHATTEGTIHLEKQNENDLNVNVINLEPVKESKKSSGSSSDNVPLAKLQKKWQLSLDQNAIKDTKKDNLDHKDVSNNENKKLSNYHADNFLDLEEEAVSLNKSGADISKIHNLSLGNNLVDEDDVTPDLDLHQSGENQKASNRDKNEELFNNISAFSDATDDPSKKLRRKLYNPGDLSHLQASITEEYLKTNDKEVLVTKSPKPKSRKKNLEIKSKKKGKKEKKLRLTKSGTSKRNENGTEGPFAKSFNALKQKLRDFKKKNKATKRRLRKNSQSSTSSSSMIPFGVALGDVRTRKRSASVQSGNAAKRHREERRVTDENSNKKDDQHRKIRIISNVVIQPRSNNTPPQQENSTYEDLVKMTNQYYLQFIKFVERDKPNLLKNGDCEAITNILQGCRD